MDRSSVRKTCTRAVLLLALLVGVIGATSAVASGAPSCDTTYQGTSSGADWNTGSNWTSGVPSASTVACIPSGDTVDVEESGDAAKAIEGTSSTYGSVDVSSGSLTLGADDTTDTSELTDLTMTGGTVTVDDTLSLTGAVSMTDATLDGPASGSATVTVGGAFSVVSDSSGSSTIGSNLSITQNGSGTFTIGEGDQGESIDSSITTNTTGTVSIDGTITGGASGVTIDSTAEPITLATGSYQEGGATVTLEAPGVVTSGATTMGVQDLVIDGSTSSLTGLLKIENGGLTLDSGDTLSTTGGGLDFDNGTSTLNGTIDGTGTFETTGSGNVTIASGATFSAPAISLNGGGTVNDDLASAITLTGLTDNRGTLNLKSTGGITDSGSLSILDGTLDGPSAGTDAVTVAGNFDDTSDQQGSSDIASNLTITQNGSGTFAIGDNANDTHGAPQLEDISSPITTNTTGTVTIDPTITGAGGTMTVTSTSQPIALGTGSWQGGGGTVTITAPGFTTSAATTMGAQALVIDGSTSSLTGVLTIENGGLTLDSNDTLSTTGGGLDFDNGSSTLSGTVSGTGTFETTGSGTVALSGAFTAPAISVNGGGTVNDNITKAISLTGLTIHNGSLNLKSTGGITDTGNLSIIDGTLAGPAQGTDAVTVAGNFDDTSDQQGSSSIGDNLTVSQTGSGTFAIGDNANDTHGAPQLEDISSAIQTSTTGTVTIDPTITGAGGTMTVTSTSQPIALGTGSWQGGGGTVTITAPGFDVASGTTLAAQKLAQNGGTMDLTSGDTLAVPNGYTVQSGTLTVDGTLTAPVTQTGGTLDGTGTLEASLDQTGGTLNPGDAPGTLNVAAGYTQGSGGTLDIAVNGIGTAGTDYSQLSVTGSVSLAGTLEMEPSDAYAGSASQGDTFSVIKYTGGSLSGSFGTIGSTPALGSGETFSESNVAGAVDAVVGAAQPPASTGAPVVSGNTVVGDQLQTTNGTWTNTPSSFTYQWQDCTSAAATTCTNVASGGISSTYTLQSSDVGSYVIVVVTAHNAAATSGTATGAPVKGPVTNPAPPPPTAPKNTAPPSISGTPASGKTVTCSPGSWSPAATSYAYTWAADGTPVIGATTGTYTVQQIDEGLTLTCTVIASNTGGHSAPVTSGGVMVPIPVIKGCPAATGKLGGTTLGLIRLGMTRAQARHAFTKSTNRGEQYIDFFCLTPRGVRAGYASPKLLKTLPKSKRAGLAGRVIWASTSNGYYNVRGIRPGATLTAAKQALPGGNYFRVGANYWYLAPNGADTAVLKLRGGVVQEIGIGDKALTKGLKAQKIFMTSFE